MFIGKIGKETHMIKKSREYDKKHNILHDDKGSAIVVVIIAMAFIGILVSVLMYTSLLNYQMKRNNYSAKDNFYSAETVFDEIRMGIQGEVSTAIGKSYQNILTNFDSATSEDKQFRMRYGFLSQIQKDYMVNGDTSKYNLETLYGYLTDATKASAVLETELNGSTYTIYEAADSGAVVKTKDGAVYTEATPLCGSMKLYNGSLVLENVKVTYTDDKGYVSIISTDLRITAPDMDFAGAVSLPSITAYSLVSRDRLLVYPDVNITESASTAKVTVSGSVYCGGLTVGTLPESSNLQTGGVTLNLTEDGSASALSSEKRIVVDGDILVGQGSSLKTDENGELWADAITMNGSGKNAAADKYSTVEFAGNSVYVADDTNINGNGNKFIAGKSGMGGQYIGFGNSSEAAESSAIVVNGTNTEIDVSNLSNLTLAGNAYIGVGTKDSLMQDAPDVLMGQSIAVKSDQIAYLIPAECIGIDKETGEQVKGVTNPMTYDFYESNIANKAGEMYEVSDEKACDALGGKTLKDFGVNTTDGNKTINYQKYFVQGTTGLVYYYVAFDSTSSISKQNANDYFAAYYTNNKSTLDAYSKLYTSGIVLNGDGVYRLHIGGNVVRYSSEGNVLSSSTSADDKNNVAYNQMLNSSQLKYTALCKKLLDNYEQLGASETAASANAYTNLVKESKIEEYYNEVAKDTTVTSDDAMYFTQGNIAACIVGDTYYSETRTYYEYTGSGKDNYSGLIIATGDVKISADFKGTVISGGKITLAKGVTVQNDKDAVETALTITKNVNGQVMQPSEFLVGGSGYIKSSSQTYNEDTVDLGDLVSYENWKKE